MVSMRTTITAAVVSAAVAAASAGAAVHVLDPRVPALKRQVTAIAGRLVTMQAALNDESVTRASQDQAITDRVTCNYALQLDGFQGEGYVLGLLSQTVNGLPNNLTAPATLFNDNGACQRIGAVRPPYPFPHT